MPTAADCIGTAARAGLRVQASDTALVLKCLEPIWTTKAETASRVRGRIESVLDWAKVRGYRTGENPARWRAHLDILLPARAKVRRVEHHRALPYAELPGFMAALREQAGVAARALEFTILTAARSGETRFARWSEFDLLDKTWTVPAERMKGGRLHRQPLCSRTLVILKGMQADRPAGDVFVFPRNKTGQPLHDPPFRGLLQRMGRGRGDRKVHGRLSSFSD